MTHGKSKPHLTCGLTCELSSFLVFGRTIACEIKKKVLFGIVVVFIIIILKSYFIKIIFI
jgi:hypothetical protein